MEPPLLPFLAQRTARTASHVKPTTPTISTLIQNRGPLFTILESNAIHKTLAKSVALCQSGTQCMRT